MVDVKIPKFYMNSYQGKKKNTQSYKTTNSFQAS